MLPGGGEIWYGTRNPLYYVKLIGAPGTLAGDILRWKSDLPQPGNYRRRYPRDGVEIESV